MSGHEQAIPERRRRGERAAARASKQPQALGAASVEHRRAEGRRSPRRDAKGPLALVSTAARIRELVLESDGAAREVSRLTSAAAKAIGCSPEIARLLLAHVVARDVGMLEVAPDRAIGAQLRALDLLAGIAQSSLWGFAPDGRLRRIASLGEDRPTRAVRDEARRVLAGESRATTRRPRTIEGVCVRRWGTPSAALVVRLPARGRDAARAAAATAAEALCPVLERAALLEDSAGRDWALTEIANRRLARLTLDMHDGPLQDIVALLSDVRLYRAQLGRVLHHVPHADLLLGRVDDFEARLLAIDDDLRELAQSFESPSVLERPFREVVEGEIKMLRARTGIAARLEFKVDVDALTPSQRIAIIRILQEALTNVRDHSGASEVSVSIVQAGGATRVRVVDDGRGFDVGPTLVRAGRNGRLGLVGMAERVRLLGGTFDLHSEPGAGTAISVVLPEWRPLGVSTGRS